MKLSVVVPAYNEEEVIGSTLASLIRSMPQAEIVVVDDGSQDQTADTARGHGVRVIRQANTGKAGALANGLAACSGDIIAMVDADMGHGAGEIGTLVEAVREEKCEMAIALFSRSQGGGVGLVRNLAQWGIFLLTGTRLTAPLSGQRAATRRLLEECLPHRGGFGLETELTLRALRRGYRVQEIPTGFVHRGGGWTVAGFCHRGRQFIQVAQALVRGGIPWR